MQRQSTAAIGAAISLLLLSVLPSQAMPYHWHGFYDAWSYPLRCLTRAEITRGLATQGFAHIVLRMPTQSEIQAQARLGRFAYVIDVDYCDGHIEGLINTGPR